MFDGLLIHALVAVSLGYFIGLEREWHKHYAGMRTNALVSLGACAFVYLGMQLHDTSQTRVIGQVVSGLGFIAGGCILREGINVQGLTTAATVWVSGAAGSICGTGHYTDAITLAYLVVVVNLSKRLFNDK